MRVQELYQKVTNTIIADLEAGVPSWIKPWRDGKCIGIMPQNAALVFYSGKR